VSIKGSPYAYFRRTLETRKLSIVLPAAAEFPWINLGDSLEILTLMAQGGDPRFDVNAFREYLLDRELSARTTNKILTLLHGVFKLAMERGTVATNPVAVARKAKEGKKKLGQYLQKPPRS
jgi:hypothetical protein